MKQRLQVALLGLALALALAAGPAAADTSRCNADVVLTDGHEFKVRKIGLETNVGIFNYFRADIGGAKVQVEFCRLRSLRRVKAASHAVGVDFAYEACDGSTGTLTAQPRDRLLGRTALGQWNTTFAKVKSMTVRPPRVAGE